MRIGIIGSGRIGGTVGALLARAGHEVALSNSRGPDSLADLVARIGPNARAATAQDAAEFGEVILLATPFGRPEALPAPEAVASKIVIDAMNPYSDQGGVLDLGGKGSSEVTAERLPGARVVKAFNTIHFKRLEEDARPQAEPEARLVVLVAGDDAEAKEVVTGLIDQIGFTAVDTGTLREGGRRQAPGSPLYNVLLRPDEARQVLAATP